MNNNNYQSARYNKKGEVILRASEIQYRQLLETIPVGIGIADQNGNLLAYNNAMLQPSGYTRQDVEQMGNNVLAFYYDAGQRAEVLALYQKHGFLKDFPVQLKRKDGTPYGALLSLSPILYNDQPCIQALVEDVSGRESPETALRVSDARLASIIDTAMDAIISIDSDQRITLFNAAAEQMFRCSAAEAIGQSLDLFIPVRFRLRHRKDINSFGRSSVTKRMMGRVDAVSIIGLRADGAEFPAEASISQTEVSGRKTYTVILRDISERKEAEKLREVLLYISNAAISVDTLEELYAEFHRALQNIMVADNFFIALYDQKAGLLSFPYFVDEKEPMPAPYPLGRGLTEYVLRSGKPLLGRQERIAKLIHEGQIDAIGPASIDWLGVPLNLQEKIIGVMAIQTYREGIRYTQRELDIMTIVSSQVAQCIERKRAEASLRESEKRYRAIFESTGVPIWEEDYSAVMLAINELKAQGVMDLPRYLDEHPEFLQYAAQMIKILDMNRAALKMLGAGDKAELLGSLARILDQQALQSFREEILALAEGKQYYENESYAHTLLGERRDQWVTITFPVEETDYRRVLVSTLDITERKNRERQLEAIAAVSATLRGTQTRAEMLPVIVEQFTSLTGAEGCALLLRDPSSGEAVVEATRGQTAIETGSRIPPGKGIAGHVIETGRPYVTNEFPDNPLSYYRERSTLKAVIGMPLTIPGGTIGALQIFGSTPFPDSLMPVLASVANMAANAIHRVSLYEESQLLARELSQAYEETLTGWARALELRDEPTQDHTRRVVELTLRLVRELSVPEADLEHIRRGAILHDIGKMGIPDIILRKPSRLTSREKNIMRRHPQYAYDMLSTIPFLQNALDIPYCHHERWDGKGYPRGLKGEQIPLAARIFAVVDVWDALRFDRPYRKAWSKAKTLKYIRDQSGKHFDPQVVEKFLALEEI